MLKSYKNLIFERPAISGFVFLEILIAIALVSVVFITLLSIGLSSLNISASIQKTTRADFLIKEEFESLRNFRDGTTWATNGLGMVNTGSSYPYHLVNSSNNWTLVAGAGAVDSIFVRQIIFDKVSRNKITNDIESVYNASNDDPDTRMITITVAWPEKTLKVVSYLTNWKND